MSFLKGLMKFAAPALMAAAPLFPPLAAAGPLASGLMKAGAAGAAGLAAGGGGGQAAPPPEAMQPITGEMQDPQTGGPQNDLSNVNYSQVLQKPKRSGLAGLLGGGLAGYALKSLLK